MKSIWKSAAAGMAFAAMAAAPALADKATAELRDAEGVVVATVTMADLNGGMMIRIEAKELTPGFHGFHIHAVGACEPPDFSSAGGHFNPDGADHADHAGDLPNLLVMADGTASMRVATDRMTVADLLDGDGAAVIIHADPDNHAHIPERYADQPDEDTLATGDAGARVACGVVTE